MPAWNTTELTVMDLERRYWEAVKHSDSALLEHLTAENFTLVMSEGVLKFDKHALATMLTAPGYRLMSYSLDEQNAQVRQLGEDVAVVSYQVMSDYERDGRYQQATSFNSSTWVKNGGDWKCAVVTESLVPDAVIRE